MDEELLYKFFIESPENLSDSSDSSSSSTCSWFSETDSDEEPRQSLSRIQNYLEITVRGYNLEEFKKNFRLSHNTTYILIDMLARSNFLPTHKDGREKITAEKALLLCIWYLSNQETFREVSDRFGVTYSSAYRTLRRCLRFFLSMKFQIINWPTGEQVEIVKNGFRSKQGMEDILGAIDETHIKINKPKKNQDAYINRKGYHSLLLQGIVDHEKRFIDVFCGEPGSMHDARLLRKSAIYDKLQNNPNHMNGCFLIGDTAYPNLDWLVTPFRDNGHLTGEEKRFSYRLSSSRVVVENAFGLLKGRFRRLRKMDNINVNLCSELIMVACIIHNICLNKNYFIEAELTDFNQPQHIPFTQNICNIIENSRRQKELLNK